ncbi:MAG TPA: type II toxin-antitoxin system HicA family toxin [Candidatus Aenigmarchaeota archaeon]|nr:type II toxin-antitoxin system HicA family toxin [Candidatus Aenigmarchaeota archaeon]
MKVLSGKEVIKRLSKKGFRVVSQKGSHIKLKKDKNGKVLIVTVPTNKELTIGVLLNILKQAEMTKEELLK